MIIKYLFSAPKGDIPVGADDLTRPFLVSPGESHLCLTLGDYFEAIKDFILKDSGRPLIQILSEQLNDRIGLESITEILIRSEKHGALYHLASVEVFSVSRSLKFSVSTAVSEYTKACLRQEFDNLSSLNKTVGLPYLPRPYFKAEIRIHTGFGDESLSMFLTEWFENYHEWHLSIDETGGGQRICIWDLIKGHQFVSKWEGLEIFRQASKILTLYYDTRNFNQIYPWHHAAGDFVARSNDGTIDVKLTTVRRYGPIMVFALEDTINPMVAMIYFFLNLSVKMRLDRLDGMGDRAWAGGFSLVQALTKGFFEGLRIMEADGRYHLGQVRDLVSLFKTFGPEELETLFHPLLDLYTGEDAGDFSLIKANLESHVKQLHQAIQSFHLTG